MTSIRGVGYPTTMYVYGGIRSTDQQFDYGGYDSKTITNVANARLASVGIKFDYTGDDRNMDEFMVSLDPGMASVKFSRRQL